MKNWFKHSVSLLKHELRRGELTIVALAIVLAVSAVFSLTGFSNHIKDALVNESTAFIAADRVWATSRELPQSVNDKASELNLATAKQVFMSSMVFSKDRMVLSSLTAVTDLYPLRGELLVEIDAKEQAVNAPNPGYVWVQPAILTKLAVGLGDAIEVGNKSFIIAGIINQIPDASFSVFTSGPTIILHADDLEATGLIQPGSRIWYEYLFAGEPSDINDFEQWVKPQVNESQRWYDIKDSQSSLASALNRAEQYLSLASMLGVVLAAVAVAVAGRRYAQRQQSVVAIFKAMGTSKAYVRRVYLLHWSLLSTVSILVGLVVGALLLALGINSVKEQLKIQGALIQLYPVLVASFTGIICACAFAFVPLKQLLDTSPLSILRGFNQHKLPWYAHIPAISALFLLLFLFSQNLALSVALVLGGLLVSGIILLCAKFILLLSRSAGARAGKAWHLALANLKRRANENAIQLISFTVAIELLLLIFVMKGAIIDEWQRQLPDDTANRFLINIAHDNIDQVSAFIEQNNIVSSGLYPVVRGRLTAINDTQTARRVTKEDDSKDDNARRGVGRELNLTWRADLPSENTILAGSWWQADSEQGQVSIEHKLAERLDVAIGDNLTFQIGSDVVTVPITSIREVNWNSLQPNFYMIFSPSVLADFPASYINSMYISEENKPKLQRFLTDYPTISMIDVEAIIRQLRSVISQVSLAIEFVLILVVLAGSLVLVAQVQASMEERERELAILKTLGAKSRVLNFSVLYEFIALGAVAGLMASIAMELAVYILQTRVFDMAPSWHLSYWLLGIASGAAFVGTVGFLSCTRLLKLSSVTLIRRTM
ncbi:FtsX-like permease family protein [Thalassotalea sp. LPB0316]|uniref:ABC transporter permease n=1 Tax=Thalassotalea sp. LPB0316 TaxID=2769490 RepID=UPI00186754F2|nr:FtsX-like permease family protein [Thalassotalea sp. LPB0316]QOL24764.1 FtsX-like permease family protein [Thalassotalea sp. LPB0316]